MDLPKSIPHFIVCPSCTPSDLNWNEQLAGLEWQIDAWGHPYLVYYCKNCKNGFTTTESDTISLERYNSKKRSVLRKNKISKLNGL
jgi:hypothetical protein